MTEEQINIAIAESLGWKLHSELDETWCAPHQSDCPLVNELVPRPNYTTSRDACAEFEAKLTKDREMEEYIWYLNRAHPTADIHYPYEYGRRFAQELRREVFGIATSKPIQRCEAYLRVIGAWKESNQQPK